MIKACNNTTFDNLVTMAGEAFYNEWTPLQVEPLGDNLFLTISAPQEPDTINPLASTSVWGWKWMRMYYDKLVRLSPEIEPQPWAAEEINAIDETTIDVVLREGMTWHDGEGVTVDDVKFTFDYYIEQEFGYFAPFLRPIESVEVIDERTVRFNLSEPFSPFITVTLSQIPLLPEHIWADIDNPDELAPDAIPTVGSGPFVHDRYDRGEYMRMTTNRDHFAAEDVRIDGIEMIIYADAEGVFTGLQTGEIDMTAWRLEPPLGEVAISGAASIGEEAMAVGREGTAYWFDGERWSPLDTPFAHDLYAVALKPDGRALAVGEGGAVFMRGGGGWEVFEAPESINLFGVAWLDEARALLVGAEETLWLLDLNSPRFTVLESPVGRGLTLASVALDIDGTALAVGERGLALRVTPEASVELERLPTFRDLNHVAISPAGNALIVGERGTLVRRVDNDWVEDAAPDTRALRAGWIGDEGHALAVGRNGVVLEYDGEIWTRAEILTERHFRAAIVAGDTAFALGSDRFVNKLAPPSGEHLFGTDHLGRDLFSQNVYGSRVALLVGFIGALLVVLIGANVGLIAGYYRGRAETFLMRAVDVMYGIPFEPFAMILVLLFDPSLTIVILAVALLTWRTVARLIRSQVLSLSERPFVKAARVAGASDLRIMYLHIFPNVLPLVFLELAIIVGVAIIAEATLSFLGLGPPQSISWGGILHNARLSGAWRTAWWWNIPPGLFIMLTVLSVFFVSRSLEVIANPRLRVR